MPGPRSPGSTMRHAASIMLLALLPAAHAWAAQSGAAQRCADLAGRRLGGAEITSAGMISPDPGPGWQSPTASVVVHVPFCRLFVRVDRTIGYELWLPGAAAWNRRLLAAGVGGSAGTYNFRGLALGVERGFASASTDTGHLAADAHWMLDARAAENYAHRAVHRMTVTAKAIVKTYYGSPASFAYFTGCSGGGRAGLKELQHYPADYDGILAGAPGPDMPRLSVRHMLAGLWQEQSGITVTDADWNLVQRQAIASCDALDGLRDGVIEDPRRCHVDLAELGCRPGRTDDCLNPAKLALVERIVGPIDDGHGHVVDGGLLPGVRSRPGPPPALVAQLFGEGVHHDANWDPATFDPQADLAAAYRRQPELRADDPHVNAFVNHGGRLILYQGWMDPSVIAQQTVGYFEHLVDAAGGAAAAARFSRLYVVPGMYHCRGGDSTDQFGGEAGSVADDPQHDALDALVAWREHGVAPDALIAAKVEGGRIVRTRPLCPYPAHAAYGGGAADSAASFSCVNPAGL